MAFFIPSIQFFFGLSRALFQFTLRTEKNYLAYYRSLPKWRRQRATMKIRKFLQSDRKFMILR